MARGPPVDEQTLRRALKFLALPHGRVKEACQRYGVTESALRRAKKELGPVRLTLEDLVLAGLDVEKPLGLKDLQGYLDWLDHAVYPEAEILSVLTRLTERGLVRAKQGCFVLAAPWP
ncbi:MAG: hypothetical protein QM765_40715 [Myxococcales bacterium]